MEKKLFKQDDKARRWCEAEISYQHGRLSITGMEGRIASTPEARRMAREFWESFFEDDQKELGIMALKYGRRTPRSAARYVLQVDGEFHGLDVLEEKRGKPGQVFLVDSCGCIHETLQTWFPELASLLPWHLNDMNAGCEHQDALRWGRGRDVALDPEAMTQPQRDALLRRETAKCLKAQAEAFSVLAREINGSAYQAAQWWEKIMGRGRVLDEAEGLKLDPNRVATWPFPPPTVKEFWAKLRAHLAAEHQPVVKAEIFKDSIGAPCPTCGYCYGTAWLKRELPEDIKRTLAQVLGVDHV